jgi:hypothetical protein
VLHLLKNAGIHQLPLQLLLVLIERVLMILHQPLMLLVIPLKVDAELKEPGASMELQLALLIKELRLNVMPSKEQTEQFDVGTLPLPLQLPLAPSKPAVTILQPQLILNVILSSLDVSLMELDA